MNLKVKPLVLTSLFVALYFVLELVPIVHMPQGGSATLCSTLFLVLPGFIYGKRYGVVACISASLLSYILDPYFLAPIQFLLDYTLSKLAWTFGAFLFSNKSKFAIEKYYIVGFIFSFIFGTLSGIVYFASYTPEGMNPIVYSVVYNLGYRLVECIIVLVVLRLSVVKEILNKEIQKALN